MTARPTRPATDRRPVIACGLAAVLVLVLAGCGGSRWQTGPLPLDDPAALQAMVPDDPARAADFYARLADANFFAGLYDAAASAADRALELVPRHGGARYVQGLLLEHEERWRDALAVYADADRYTRMDRGLTRRMHSRRSVVTREILRQESLDLLARDDVDLAPNTLVVHRFQPLGTARADTVLALGVTDFLTSSFALVDGLTVIDRTRQEMLAAEIDRSRNLAFDQETRLVERKIGAGLAVTGQIGPAADDPELIQARYAVDDLIAGRDHSRHLELTTSNRYLLQDLGKQVVTVCEDQLGLTLPVELQQRLARPPTSSYRAFLAYAEGLLLESEGDYPAAMESFDQALQLDPGFGQAQLGAERVGGVGAGGDAVSLAEPVQAPSLPAADLVTEVLDLAAGQVDDLPGGRHQEPDEAAVAHSTIRIEIVVNPR